MAEQLMATMRPWFAAAFDKAGMKERVTWELVFGISQSPEGTKPQLLVYGCIPAAQLGQFHLIFAQMNVLGLTAEAVEVEVAKVVEELFRMRSAALFQGNGHLAGGHPAGSAMPWPPPPDGATPIRPIGP